MTVSFSKAFPVNFTPDTMCKPSFRDCFERGAYDKYKLAIQQYFLSNNHFRYEETISHALLSSENIQRLLSNISACGFKTTAYPLGEATVIVVSLTKRESSQAAIRSPSPGWDLSFNVGDIWQKLAQELGDTPLMTTCSVSIKESKRNEEADEAHARKAHAEIADRIITTLQEKPDVALYNFSLSTKSRCPNNYKRQIAQSLIKELQEKGFQATIIDLNSAMPIIQVINTKAKSIITEASSNEGALAGKCELKLEDLVKKLDVGRAALDILTDRQRRLFKTDLRDLAKASVQCLSDINDLVKKLDDLDTSSS